MEFPLLGDRRPALLGVRWSAEGWHLHLRQSFHPHKVPAFREDDSGKCAVMRFPFSQNPPIRQLQYISIPRDNLRHLLVKDSRHKSTVSNR
ncbi:hypothetical protein BaRGS_00030475 [Batillaria attramentaria]|uniref:Uncharacterized protein n=1 Tax=Batillaria attramentaria TaxID=370345 RepID=A0ABD0JTT2_9CAEN